MDYKIGWMSSHRRSVPPNLLRGRGRLLHLRIWERERMSERVFRLFMLSLKVHYLHIPQQIRFF